MKVFVLADDDEIVVLGVRPDRAVRGGGQADAADMEGLRVDVSQRFDKTSRQVLVEKQFGWLLRQPEYSGRGARARQRKPGRRGYRRR